MPWRRSAAGTTIWPSFIENALRASPHPAEAVVTGHARKYLVALIEIDFDTVAAQDTYNIGLTGVLTGPPASTYALVIAMLRVRVLVGDGGSDPIQRRTSPANARKPARLVPDQLSLERNPSLDCQAPLSPP
ncbi:MAG TPA: hypothetical protein VFZ16_13495 [Hyphomicrobiaceae bacterium]|nr:hypothetical protein [Hyphomicrobiaceae bacterium]